MVRLQRVTFTALHQYLGLSAELVNQGHHKKRQSPCYGSPVRSKTKETLGTPMKDTNETQDEPELSNNFHPITTNTMKR